jgi:tetratricopeptide (TPR) repeat protein
MSDFHLFISYARADDQPPGGGWVTAFKKRLETQHLHYAGRPLRAFFDTDDISEDAIWQDRLRSALRTSRLFLAFLSPNYLASKVCRWEFEEYLRMEHTLARGDEGVKQVYFVPIPGLHDADPANFGPDLERIIADIQRRNLRPGQHFELIDWYSEGADLLKEIDAEERLAALRSNPQSDRDRKIISLADQMAAIDRAIARRLDQTVLAEIAPGNMDSSYANFVGRADELRQLHTALLHDRIGLVGALHGLGGQGKTALAVQYAYAYAGHYAAGGRWILEAEGRRHLADVLQQLPAIPELGLSVPETPPGFSESEARSFQVRAILAALRQRVEAGAAALPKALADTGELHTSPDNRPEIQRHVLLILDNVDQADLMSSAEAAGLAGQDWLQVVMTTRLDPAQFGAADERLSLIPVDDLPPADALALLRRLRPFANTTEETAARAIVDLLGGFTLGVELVGAHLSGREELTYAGYLERLTAEGLASADAPAEDKTTAGRIRHRDKQVGRIVEDTLAALPVEAREILHFATLFPPDQIVVEWLRPLVAHRFPDLAPDKVKPGYPDPFLELMRELDGRRLLPVSAILNPYRDDLRMVRMHRLVAAHLAETIPPSDLESRRALTASLAEQIGLYLESAWQSAPQAVAWMVSPLVSLTELLHKQGPTSATARALSCLSGPESRLGLFDRGLQLETLALETRQRLHEANPNDAQAARDLSVSLNKLGDFYLRRGLQGDADKALKAFQDSLETRQRLHEANPNDTQAARDLSVSHFKLAQYLSQQGDEAGASAQLQACFAILDAFHRDGRPMDPAMQQLHGQLSAMSAGGGAQAPGANPVSDAAVDAILADADNRAQLDQALKAGGVAAGLDSLTPDQQRAIVRQILAQLAGGGGSAGASNHTGEDADNSVDAETPEVSGSEETVSDSPVAPAPEAQVAASPSPTPPAPTPAPPPASVLAPEPPSIQSSTRLYWRKPAPLPPEPTAPGWIGWAIVGASVVAALAFAATRPELWRWVAGML